MNLILKVILLLFFLEAHSNEDHYWFKDRVILRHLQIQELVSKIPDNNFFNRNIITVGPDNNCLFNSLQEALDVSSSNSEIRIAAPQSLVEDILFPVMKNFKIKGGYHNCTQAAANIGNGSLTTIKGTATQSVIRFQTSSPQNIVLENLKITNGHGQVNGYQGGGISAWNANIALTLNNITISNNHGYKGGGISVSQGNVYVFINDVNIQNNSAVIDGGGLYCNHISTDGGGMIINQSIINDNHTDEGAGAGVFQNGCFAAYYSSGVKNNVSATYGGGMALLNSDVRLFGFNHCVNAAFCLGDDLIPFRVASNTAKTSLPDINKGWLAGGIFISDSRVIASGIDIDQNHAYGGGGLAIDNSLVAIVPTQILGISQTACWSAALCNQIRRNVADAYNISGGAAILAFGGSNVIIGNAWIKENYSHYASAIGVGNVNTKVRIEGSLITQNGNHGQQDYDSNSLFVLGSFDNGAGSTLELIHTTIADNQTSGAIVINEDGHFKATYSIFDDPNQTQIYYGSDIYGPNSSDFFCVLGHEDDSIGSWFNIVGDPHFVDPSNHDYHLNITSPAVDYCFEWEEILFLKDIDGNTRGTDNLNVDNIYGAYDLGFDEY